MATWVEAAERAPTARLVSPSMRTAHHYFFHAFFFLHARSEEAAPIPPKILAAVEAGNVEE